MKFPLKCYTCRTKSVNPVTLPTYSTEIDHDGRCYAIELVDVDVWRCEKCGEIVLNDLAHARITSALREKANLLRPEQIRAARERLGLTQKELASCLGIAESTLSRWETGAQIQQRCMNNFLKVFFESAEARSLLTGVGA